MTEVEVAPEPIIVSYSELDTFRQCPLKHYLGYVMRYTKPVKEGSALAKGSLYHLVMETLFKTILEFQNACGGKIPDAMHAEVLKVATERVMTILWDSKIGAYYNPTCELIAWMYRGYVDQYGIHPEWRIVAVEHQIVTPLPDEFGNDSIYHLKAKLDLVVVVRATGLLWVIDHKSGQNLPSQMDLEIDDQFGLYCWAMRKIGKKVQGAIHSANRTQRNKSPMTLDSRMALTYMNRSDKELNNIARDAYFVALAAHPPPGQNRARYSSPDPRSCGWKCDFKEPHLIARKGRDINEVMHEYGFRINRTRH